MVYVHKKNINGHSYYYLRKSYRVKGKIHVIDLKYLGKEAITTKEYHEKM